MPMGKSEWKKAGDIQRKKVKSMRFRRNELKQRNVKTVDAFTSARRHTKFFQRNFITIYMKITHSIP